MPRSRLQKADRDVTRDVRLAGQHAGHIRLEFGAPILRLRQVWWEKGWHCTCTCLLLLFSLLLPCFILPSLTLVNGQDGPGGGFGFKFC